MKKRVWLLVFLGLAVYLSLLFLLTAAESGAAGATIHHLGDAFWFSLVTLTTVGFGDTFPVSPLGRALGLVFVLLSAGLLASVIGLASGLLREHLAALRIRSRLRRHPCWLFSEMNPASLALAENLLRESPEPLAVFFGPESRNHSLPARRVLFVPGAPDQILRDCGKPLALFLVSPDAMANEMAAEKLRSSAPLSADSPASLFSNLPIHCRGTEIAGGADLHYFDEYSCAARAFWGKYPLRPAEEEIWILGSGKLARALLDQAVLTNCRLPFHRTVYHLFGSWSDYARMHPGLRQVFSPDVRPDQDALIFHDEPWSTAPDALCRAHRLLFCEDDPMRNSEAAAQASRLFPLSGTLYIAGPAPASLGVSFGDPEEIWTAETVLRGAQDRYARLLHSLYSRSVGAGTPWEDLSSFQKASNRAAADHLPTKLRLLLPEAFGEAPPVSSSAGSGAPDSAPDAAGVFSFSSDLPALCRQAAQRWESESDREPWRRNEHHRWMRFHCLYNWRFGPKKDARTRTHPDITDYDSLSPEDQAKDDFAWQILGSIR